MREYWACPNSMYAITHMRKANLRTKIIIYMDLGLLEPVAGCMASNEKEAAERFKLMGVEFGKYSSWES